MNDPTTLWQCQMANCGYIYDPARGDRRGKIPKGVLFTDLPESWRCPVCGATVKSFVCLGGDGSSGEALPPQSPPQGG